jgi:hypothetical protein
MSSSQFPGIPATEQEANDVLQKLMTESTRVQLLFFTSSNVWSGAQGKLLRFKDGRVGLKQGEGFSAFTLIFDPRKAIARVWADAKLFPVPAHLADAGAPSVESALCFIFPDKSMIGVFELADI